MFSSSENQVTYMYSTTEMQPTVGLRAAINWCPDAAQLSREGTLCQWHQGLRATKCAIGADRALMLKTHPKRYKTILGPVLKSVLRQNSQWHQDWALCFYFEKQPHNVPFQQSALAAWSPWDNLSSVFVQLSLPLDLVPSLCLWYTGTVHSYQFKQCFVSKNTFYCELKTQNNIQSHPIVE